MSKTIVDLTGQIFSELTVVNYAGVIPCGKVRASAWHCVCSCGNTITVLANNLKRGNTKSCGCLKKTGIKVNLTGYQFGLLKVLSLLDLIDGNSIWLCECECGKNCKATGCSLQTGQKKSCGCKQGWWRSSMPGLWKNPAAYAKWKRQDPIVKIRHSVSGSIRSMIKKNGSYKRKKSIRNYLPYTIEELKNHLESLWEPWMNWENYGGKSNDKNRTWHIDHICPHSSFNYKTMDDPLFLECWSLKNLRPLEKIENMSKGAKFL